MSTSTETSWWAAAETLVEPSASKPTRSSGSVVAFSMGFIHAECFHQVFPLVQECSWPWSSCCAFKGFAVNKKPQSASVSPPVTARSARLCLWLTKARVCMCAANPSASAEATAWTPSQRQRTPVGGGKAGPWRKQHDQRLIQKQVLREGELEMCEEALMVQMYPTWKWNQNHSLPSLSFMTNWSSLVLRSAARLAGTNTTWSLRWEFERFLKR